MKFFLLQCFLRILTQSAQHFKEKRERSGAGAGSVLVANGSGMRIREAQKHKDPDQDAGPEHCFKGTVSRDFFLLVFFMNQFPPSPRVSH
jgi:hypothetical protein